MAGAYTLILSLGASPSPAKQGDTVTVVVSIRNLYSQPIYICASGKFNGTSFSFTPSYATVNPGESYLFSGSFTMPDKKVRVYTWSYYWTGSEWYADDEAYVDIDLTELKPEFSQFAISDYRNLTR